MPHFELDERRYRELVSALQPLLPATDADDVDRLLRAWLSDPKQSLVQELQSRGYACAADSNGLDLTVVPDASLPVSTPPPSAPSGFDLTQETLAADHGGSQGDVTNQTPLTVAGSASGSYARASQGASSQGASGKPREGLGTHSNPAFELTYDGDGSTGAIQGSQNAPSGIPSDMLATMDTATPGQSLGGASTHPAPRGAVTQRSRFEYVRPLDKGGLGVLEVARDRELGREVALKRIRPDKAGTALYRSKFIREAEVTGNLEHPGIVPVYGLGVDERGQPYYAMRLIRGKTLAQRIRKFLADTAQQPRPYQSQDFMRLIDHFLTVCQTIAFAHDRGVIHRDLKPVNIMVGKYGETFVVDWGLAKAVGDPHDTMEQPDPSPHSSAEDIATATRYGTALGTPAYAPPEQVMGKLELIDARSDIYGLGAILFEILSGEPPVTGKNLTELIQRASSGEVREITALRPGVPKPLAAICRKCLAYEPSARYPNVHDLIADVECWKSDLPVTAHREHWLARLHRWTRRHRGVTLASAAGILMVAVVSTAASIVIFRQKEEVSRSRSEEQHARKLAETARDFLVDAFRSPDPRRDGRTITVEEVLKRTSQQIDHDLKEEPQLQATMNLAMGRSFLGLGLPREAVERLQLAADQLASVSTDQADALIRTKQAWGNALRLNSELQASVEMLSQAESESESLFGPTAPLTLDLQVDLAESLLRFGQIEEAISKYRQVFDQRRMDQGLNAPETLAALHGLANARFQAGRIAEADLDFATAYDGRRETLGPLDLDTLNSLAGRAQCQLKAGRVDLAIKQYEEVLHGRTNRLGKDHMDRLDALSDLAGALRTAGRDQEAIALLVEAHERYLKTLGEDSTYTLNAAGNLAEAYEATGQLPDSVNLLTATLRGMSSKYPEDHPSVLTVKHNLAYANHSAGNMEQAAELYQQVIDARTRTLGADHPDTLVSQVGYAETLAALDRLNDAQPILEAVLAKRIEQLAADHPDIAATRIRLADVQRLRGELGDADKNYTAAIKALSERLGENHRDTLIAKTGQARCWLEQNRIEESIDSLKKIEDELTSQQGSDHPDVLQVMVLLGNAYRKTSQLDQAMTRLEKAQEKLKDRLGEDHPTRLEAIYSLAATYDQMGLADEADEVLQQTLTRQSKGESRGQRAAIETAILLTMHRIQNQRPRAARDAATVAAELSERLVGLSHPSARRALSVLAEAYFAERTPSDAEKVLRRLLTACDNTPGIDPTEIVSYQSQLATSLQLQQRTRDALPLWQACTERWRELRGPGAPETLNSALDWALAARECGEHPIAVDVLRDRETALVNAKAGPDDRWEGLVWLADSLMEIQQLESADAALRQALELTVPGTWPSLWATALHGKLTLAQGKKEEGLRELEDVGIKLQSLADGLPSHLRTLPDSVNQWIEAAKK